MAHTGQHSFGGVTGASPFGHTFGGTGHSTNLQREGRIGNGPQSTSEQSIGCIGFKPWTLANCKECRIAKISMTNCECKYYTYAADRNDHELQFDCCFDIYRIKTVVA